LLRSSAGHVFVYGGENISGQSGDAQTVIEKTESLLSEPVLCEKVKAVVTDSAGPYAKARRELSKLRPDIAFLPCFAHQINLTIGDMFKSFPEFKETLLERSWLSSIDPSATLKDSDRRQALVSAL
jgi:Protein of unknown function (DUF 659)